MRIYTAVAWGVWAFLAPNLTAQESSVVSRLKITILSTMVTEFQGRGEWGFSALVEADGNRFLFDTGARPHTVLENAEELGIDLSQIDTVVLSHNHWDHTGGLIQLRRALKTAHPSALQSAHVGRGIFLTRIFDVESAGSLPAIPAELLVSALKVREGYQAEGGRFVVHDKPAELYPGVWVTGPIPRPHPERNWTPFMHIKTEQGLVEDTIPEDQALVVNTREGLVVVAGCGHAGIVNTMEHARSLAAGTPIHAVVGGFHLMSLADEKVEWTGAKMRALGAQHVIGAHCTGIHAVTSLRAGGNYGRDTAVVGTVGSIFTLGKGIERGLLNR